MSAFEVQEYQADVLIIGGGIAGLNAAIEAASSGAKVIVLEKANTLRSGLAGSGVDHIQSYIPEFHEGIGYTPEDLARDQHEFGGNFSGLRNYSLSKYFAEHSAQDVRKLEDYGMQFKFEGGSPDGKGHIRKSGYKIVPQFHHVPTSYNFAGRDIKRVLTKQAKAAGAQIINRVHVRKLLLDANGAAAGAIGISTREEKIVVASAKTTILATQGGISRISGAGTQPGSFESFGTPTASAGAGKVLAAAAGAKVINLELTNLFDGYAFTNYSFSVGFPSGTWWPAGRIVDEDGNVVVERNQDIAEDTPNYVERYSELVDKYYAGRASIGKLLAEGKRLYFDLQEATDDELENIWWALGHEGKCNVMRHHLTKNNVDFKTARFPIRIAGRGSVVPSGIWVKDDTTETDVPNLYASGDEIASAGAGLPVAGASLVFGRRSGQQAAERAGQIDAPVVDVAAYVTELQTQVDSLLNAGSGSSSWKDAERALQALTDSTLGGPYTEQSVRDNLQLLAKYKDSLQIKASNLHELSRAFETLDLYQILEFIYNSILLRTSSVGPYVRADEQQYEPVPYGTAIAVSNPGGVMQATTVQFV